MAIDEPLCPPKGSSAPPSRTAFGSVVGTNGLRDVGARGVAVAIDAGAGRQLPALAPRDLHVAIGHRARGLIEHQRIAAGARHRKAERIGAVELAVAAMRHHRGHRVDRCERKEAFAGERLDVRPHGGEVMRLAHAEHGDAVGARLGHQWFGRHRKDRQREAVLAVGAQHAGGDVLQHRHRLAVEPAAVERAEIALDAEHAVAVRAVALRPRHVRREEVCDMLAAAVAEEDRAQQRFEFGVGDMRGHSLGQVSERR